MPDLPEHGQSMALRPFSIELAANQAAELVRDRAARTPFPPSARTINRVLAAALRRGLFIYPASGMAGDLGGDAIMVTPPFVIGDEEVEFIADTLRDALDEVGSSLSVETGPA